MTPELSEVLHRLDPVAEYLASLSPQDAQKVRAFLPVALEEMEALARARTESTG